MKRKGAKLPSLRCDLSVKVLEDYRLAVRDKRKTAPMGHVDIVATSAATVSNPSAGRTFEEALKLMESGQLEDATGLILEAIRMGLESPYVYMTLGDLYKQRTQHEHAVMYYSKALEKVPEQYLSGSWDSVRIFKERAECYTVLSQGAEAVLQQAADEYDKYMLITDPTYDSLLIAGKTHLDAGNLPRAKELLLRADEVDSSDPYLHFNLGELYERMSEMKDARFHFARAVQLDNDFPTPYINQGEQLIAKGDAQSLLLALNLFLSVLKLLPTNGEMHMRIADLYDMIGAEYIESSKTMLSRALELDLPDEKMTSAFHRRGIIFQDEADAKPALRANAISDFTMCLAFDAAHADALSRRAACFLARGGDGDTVAAAKDYETLVSLTGEKGPPAAFLAGPHFFLANWYFGCRFGSPAGEELCTPSRSEHYVTQLVKAATNFEQAQRCGHDVTQVQPCVVIALRVKNGFFALLGTPPEGEEAPDSIGGIVPVVHTEETAMQVPLLSWKMLEDYYLSMKALEVCVGRQQMVAREGEMAERRLRFILPKNNYKNKKLEFVSGFVACEQLIDKQVK